jgi:hypothetical protein
VRVALLGLFLLFPLEASGQGLQLPLRTDRELERQAPSSGTSAVPAAARAGPILHQSFPVSETVPGQPLTLTLSVLVPTCLPEPPVWPDLHVPNVMVRDAGGGPTSERRGADTWSGVVRSYTIAPMIVGEFSIPPQTVAVTWADPDGGEARHVELQTEAVTFAGRVPDIAKDLDPFLAATSLAFAVDIEGTPDALAPGDSVTRSVTATVRGTSPLLLPRLMPAMEIEGVALYPDEPSVVETTEEGEPGGTRTESVTLVAEAGGNGRMPDIALDWYNIGTGEIETATVAGFDVSVSGPPARPTPSRAQVGFWAAGAAGIVLGALLWLWLLPPFGRRLKAWRTAWLASEGHAFKLLKHAVRFRDHATFRHALDLWADRSDGRDPRSDAGLQDALLALGSARYRDGDPEKEARAWTRIASALGTARRGPAREHGHARLPPLNPVA